MSPQALTIDYIRVLISLTMLGYASYKDIKTREIHDIVWIIPSAIGLAIDAYEVINGNLAITGALYNIGFMVILSGILWYLSLFGEADPHRLRSAISDPSTSSRVQLSRIQHHCYSRLQ